MMARIPYIAARGARSFPRYLVTEPNGYFWSGILWTPHEREALLFCDGEEAIAECDDIRRQEHASKTEQIDYVVPVVIETMAEKPINPEDLVAWLRKALLFQMDYGNQGNGPTPDSCILLTIHWDKLRRKEESK